MPIQESYREEAFSKLKRLCSLIEPHVEAFIQDSDPEDLEMGLRFELKMHDIEDLWKEAVEENNYMEVVYTEIMEHHDGAYLKATFRNSLENCYGERYVSIRSSGRVEISHAFFMDLRGIRIRVEKKGKGNFELFAKAL